MLRLPFYLLFCTSSLRCVIFLISAGASVLTPALAAARLVALIGQGTASAYRSLVYDSGAQARAMTTSRQMQTTSQLRYGHPPVYHKLHLPPTWVFIIQKRLMAARSRSSCWPGAVFYNFFHTKPKGGVPSTRVSFYLTAIAAIASGSAATSGKRGNP